MKEANSSPKDMARKGEEDGKGDEKKTGTKLVQIRFLPPSYETQKLVR